MAFRSHAHSTAAFVLLFATESGLNVPFLPFPILNFLSLPLASFPNGNGFLSERFRERQPFRAQVERFPKFIAPHASTQERRCKKWRVYFILYKRRRAESEKEKEGMEGGISVVFHTFFAEEEERKASDELFCPREVSANLEWHSHGR